MLKLKGYAKGILWNFRGTLGERLQPPTYDFIFENEKIFIHRAISIRRVGTLPRNKKELKKLNYPTSFIRNTEMYCFQIRVVSIILEVDHIQIAICF